MESRTVQIRGSGSALYSVVFSRTDGAPPSLRCSCQAGEKGTLCKHVRALIAGDISMVEEPVGGDAMSALGWINGSELAVLAARVDAAEAEVERAKAAAQAAKRHLARVLYGR